MNIAHIVCAGVLLLAGNAAAQDGDKPIQKTTISLGTATTGVSFAVIVLALVGIMTIRARQARHGSDAGQA